MGCVGHPGVKWLKPFSNSIGVSENGGHQKNALYLGKWWLTSVFGWYPVFKQTRMCGLVGPQNCAGFVRDTRLAGGSIWGILPFKKHHMALRISAPYTRKNSFRDRNGRETTWALQLLCPSQPCNTVPTWMGRHQWTPQSSTEVSWSEQLCTSLLATKNCRWLF